jgi:hypothetical protein
MICKTFSEMNPIEQSNYIGKLVHCVQNSELLLIKGEKIIKDGEDLGLFEGVTINPTNQETKNDLS